MKDFVTEKEASGRRCPYSFAACEGVGMGAAMARPGKKVEVTEGVSLAVMDAPAMCIASQCMAWRWSHQDAGPQAEATGFCGAFGLPKYV